MCNCMSALFSCFKGRSAQEPNQGDIPLDTMPQEANKGNTPHLPAIAAGIHESTFPTGLFLPEDDDRISGASRQSTVVESLNAADEGNDAADDGSDGSGTRHSTGNDQPSGIDDTTMSTEIQTARPVSIMRVGSARLINSRSAGTIRTVTFDLPDSPQSGVQRSATMSGINNSPSKNSTDDPVANYIKKNAETIQEAKHKWHQFANDNLRQAQLRAQRNQEDDDLYMVPSLDGTEFGVDNLGIRGKEALAHGRAPSQRYADQIRGMSEQADCMDSSNQVRRMSSTHQLRGGYNMRPMPPNNSYSGMVNPMGPDGRYRRGPNGMPNHRPQGPGMTHQSDINARRGLARLQELGIVQRLPTVQERYCPVPDVDDVPGLVGDSDDEQEEDIGSNLRKQIMAIIDDDDEDEDEEGEKKEGEEEKKPEKKLIEMTDEELKEKAIRNVEEKLTKVYPPIFSQVNKYVEDFQEVEIITQVILGLEDDIVDECANKDTADGQDLLKAKVMQIRRRADFEMKFGRMSDADFQFHADAVKWKKVDALVKKWKEEVQDEIDFPLKLKGKAPLVSETQPTQTDSDSDDDMGGLA
ncbi:hypothetical protein F4806DRAFT_508108 [Annulohypoxylon nitens]|nr:hypothetical protein F4806DRAFT_508108 [Annulohypoxylon nitens]